MVSSVRVWIALAIVIAIAAVLLWPRVPVRRVVAHPPPSPIAKADPTERPTPPSPTATTGPAERPTPPPAPVMSPHLHRVIAIDRGYACGRFFGVGLVQYDDATLVFPCMEMSAPRGLRFAVGDDHVFELEGDVVRAISLHGVRYPVRGWTVVIAPRDAYATLTSWFDTRLHVRAGAWRRDF